MGGKRVKLQIWDTAGQERFRAVTRSYYRGAAGAIIVYDISNRESFSHVQQWLNDAQQLAGEHICMMVVGNKADLQGEREVTFLEASRVAQEAEVLFLETSALTGEGVEDIFMRVARGIHAREFRLFPSTHPSPHCRLPLSMARRYGQRLAGPNKSLKRHSVVCSTYRGLRFEHFVF
jgi:small GTP-binding protein